MSFWNMYGQGSISHPQGKIEWTHTPLEGAASKAESFAHAAKPGQTFTHLHYNQQPGYYAHGNPYRYRPRHRGPGFFSLFLTLGAGMWGYSHLKHMIRDNEYQIKSMEGAVYNSQLAQSQSGAIGSAPSAPPGAVPVALQDQSGCGRQNRGWGRWGPRDPPLPVPPTQHLV